MLSQAIKNTKSLADQVVGIKGLGGPAAACIVHTQNFDAAEVPELSGLQKSTATFAQAALSTVSDLLNRLNGGTPASQLAGQLDQLKAQLDQLSTQAQTVDGRMSSYRTMFNTDVASLAQYAAALGGEVKKYQSLQQHYASEAASIKKRMDVINGISVVFPIAKLVSELASLVTASKTTEAMLSDAAGNVGKYSAQAAQANATEAMVKQLSADVSRLADAVQSARNAITITEQKLANESQFTSSAESGASVLYLNSLQSSFAQLETIAA